MGLKKNTKAHHFVQQIRPLLKMQTVASFTAVEKRYELGTFGSETGFPLDGLSRQNFN